MALVLLAVAFLLTYLVHSTILLGGASVLSTTGVVRSPEAREAMWRACLVGGLLTAAAQVASPYKPYGSLFVLPTAARPAPATAQAAVAPSALAPQPGALTPTPSPAAAASSGASPGRTSSARAVSRARPAASSSATVLVPHPNRPPSSAPIWIPALLAVWVLGAALLLARLGVRHLRFRARIAARRELGRGPLVEMLDSLRADAGIRRRIRLHVSAELSGPVAMGSSEICLPERVLTALSPAEQRAVLAHELGHLARRDPLWLACSVLLENAFFLQPLNRLARRHGQEAAELICDDWAVRRTGGNGGLTLARVLAEVAGWVHGERHPVPVSGMAEQRSQLVRRVQRLLDGEPRAVRGIRVALPAAALALSTVAFAAPAVLPPCSDGPSQPVPARAASALATASRGGAALQGEPHVWAKVQDGRLITFNPGFAPRISGEGRIGFRRGGRAVEVADDQRIEVNGRYATDEADVAVRDTDTLRITDDGGRVEWTLTPVRLSPAEAQAWERARSAEDDGALTLDSAARDTVLRGGRDLAFDSADIGSLSQSATDLAATGALIAADLAPELAKIGPRVAARVQGELERARPALERLQDESVREGLEIAADVAPRVAGLSARISAQVAEEIGPALARAFGDSCDDADSAAVRHRAKVKHR